MTSVDEKRAAFRALHQQGCFLIPNAWDAGSARILQTLGFKAIASTSAGFAWSTGRADNAVTRDAVLDHLRALTAAVDLPVNADFENAFAREPVDVAANVLLATLSGVAGLSVEDLSEDGRTLFDHDLAVDRVRAARRALDDTGADVVLVARTEGLLHNQLTLQQTIDRCVAFADAGADCIFAPGLRQADDIAALVSAVAPKPVNVVMSGPGLSFAELAALGVRRVSVGGSLARAAYSAFMNIASDLERTGDFAPLAQGAPSRHLNELFAGFDKS